MNNILIGILIGACAILPGISSGILLCCFGLYEKLINAILYFFKDIKNNLKLLLPIGIGVLIGIFLFGSILKIVFNKFYMETSFAFIGLILGSIKLVVQQSNVGKITLLHLICMFVAFSFSIYLIELKNIFIINFFDTNSFSNFILVGILMSAGIVIPGISKTVILMVLGLYEIYLSAISTINLSILFPIGIGIILGGFLFLFLIHLLFKIAKSYTYFAIIGFIFSSIFVIYPGFTFDIHGIISVFLLVISFITTLTLSKHI